MLRQCYMSIAGICLKIKACPDFATQVQAVALCHFKLANNILHQIFDSFNYFTVF